MRGASSSLRQDPGSRHSQRLPQQFGLPRPHHACSVHVTASPHSGCHAGPCPDPSRPARAPSPGWVTRGHGRRPSYPALVQMAVPVLVESSMLMPGPGLVSTKTHVSPSAIAGCLRVPRSRGRAAPWQSGSGRGQRHGEAGRRFLALGGDKKSSTNSKLGVFVLSWSIFVSDQKASFDLPCDSF